MDPQEKAELLSSIKLITQLKQLIISEGRAIYGAGELAQGHDLLNYDVVTEKDMRRVYANYLEPVYTPRLIVYHVLESAKWKLLMASDTECKSEKQALLVLRDKLQRRALSERQYMQIGNVYQGEGNIQSW